MQVDILVEEPSAEAALQNIVPRILAPGTDFKIVNFQSKGQMLDRLRDPLRGYAYRVPYEDLKVVVLVDEDREDCRCLKRKLERFALDAGLTTKSAVEPDVRFDVVNRLAIEELEAWFFGDVEALRAAYPRVPGTLARKARYRDPDAVTGGTREALYRVLKKAGYYSTYFPKIEVARRISEHMNPNRNRSRSFNHFRRALEFVSV